MIYFRGGIKDRGTHLADCFPHPCLPLKKKIKKISIGDQPEHDSEDECFVRLLIGWVGC